jgi:hypothetical protein
MDQPQTDVTPLRRMRNALDGLLGQEKSALERYTPIFEALEKPSARCPRPRPWPQHLFHLSRLICGRWARGVGRHQCVFFGKMKQGIAPFIFPQIRNTQRPRPRNGSRVSASG